MPAEALAQANAEIDQFSSQFEDSPEPSTPASTPAPVETPTEVPEVPAAAVDPWDETDSDPELPPSLRGKTKREIYTANRRAIAEANRAGLEKNDAERRALIAEATLNVLRQQVPQTQQAPEPQAHEQFGLSNLDEAYQELPRVVGNMPQVIDRRAKDAVDKAVAPLAAQVKQLTDQATFSAAENARREAGVNMKIAPEAWESVKLPVASIMQANGLDPRIEANWRQAAEAYRQHAALLVPQTVSLPVGAPPAGNTKPGASPAGGQVAKKKLTTGDARMDEMAHEILAEYNKKGIKVSFDAVVASINGDPYRRSFGE